MLDVSVILQAYGLLIDATVGALKLRGFAVAECLYN
jgi:hypothetical protein